MTETEATEILKGGPYHIRQKNKIVWPYRFLKLCFEAMMTALSKTNLNETEFEDYIWVEEGSEQITSEMTTLPVGKNGSDIIFLIDKNKYHLVYFTERASTRLKRITKYDLTEDVKEILLEHMCYLKVSNAFDKSRELFDAFGDAVMTMVESTLLNREKPKLRFDQRAVRVLRKIQEMKLEKDNVIPRLQYTNTVFRYKFSNQQVDSLSALNKAEITIPNYTEILSKAFGQIGNEERRYERETARKYVVHVDEGMQNVHVEKINGDVKDEQIRKEKFATVIIKGVGRGKECDLIFSSPLNLEDFKLYSDVKSDEKKEIWTWKTNATVSESDENGQMDDRNTLPDSILTEENNIKKIGENEYVCEVPDFVQFEGAETLLSTKIELVNGQWKKKTGEMCIYKKLTVGKIKDWTTIERKKGVETIQEGPFYFTIRDVEWMDANFVVDDTYTFRNAQNESLTNAQLQRKDLQNIKSILENYAKQLENFQQYGCATALQITRDAMKNKSDYAAAPIADAPINAASALSFVNNDDAADFDDGAPKPVPTAIDDILLELQSDPKLRLD